MPKIFLILLCSILLLPSLQSQNTTESAFSNGDIYKFSINRSGIHKISYDQLKSISGLNIDNVDPRNIHIYSQTGGILPQAINNARIDDVVEYNIWISGEEDGSFDPNDYILLYVEGPDRFNFSNNDVEFEKNVFDLNNYFFLKVESNNGLRISEKASLESTEFVSTTRERVLRHEIDRLNLLGAFGGTQGSGKRWFGESFSNQRTQDFDNSFGFSNLAIGSEAQLDFFFVGRSNSNTKVEITVDDQTFSRNISSTAIDKVERIYAHKAELKKQTINLNSNRPSVNVEFFPNSGVSEAWLDYIQIIARENNIFSGEEFYLFDRESLNYNSYGFSLQSSANIKIWDISNPQTTQEISTTNSSGNIEFGFETQDRLKTFVALNTSGSFSSPTFVEKIQNQNLHSIESAEFIIVYHPLFREAAEKLATHRSEKDNLNTRIVDILEIYNEFAGGKKDPTALRDFLRMLKQRDSNFRYLLLMGDASYDYRGILENLQYQNFVPTYETNESLNPIEAFPTDDYFALLSDLEGSDNLDGALDIGVGRIPCKTAQEALNVVEKIIYYDNNSNALGDWRMRIGFTADDEDSDTHIKQADRIAKMVEGSNPEMNQQKVYFDAYKQESTPGGARYPDANAALNANLFKGQLVLNYLGHGGPKGWADERVITVSDILNWTNLDNMPVMITATCSFTGFDEPDFVSAGEEVILNPSGGAVALFTTVRAVYASQNELLTREVFKKIFTRDNGAPLRMGDIIKESQNQNQNDTIGSNTRKFALIGDPSMQLALPKDKVVVTEFNEVEVDAESIDTIGALERVKIGGLIEDFNGNFKSDFTGKIFVTVYDKARELKTLDNDNKGNGFDFFERQNILYKGSASVTAGTFEIEIILPKDINFDYGLGHISFYATDGISKDAGGFYNQVVIGGVSDNSIVDNDGPEINIFMDDRSFAYGGSTGTDPIMIIDLKDENGINLSGTSIGHDITATIDENNTSTLVLNNFYEPTVDEVGTGSIEYQLKNLELGTHSLYVKAWDILNNASEEMIEFVVAEDIEGFMQHVFNYPNPFSTNTNFTFEHDLRNANLDVLINIYTVSGKLVKTIQDQKFASGSRVDDINWDGRDDFGSKLAKGVYLYKIKIASNELNLSRESDFQKLVILN